MKKLPKIFSLLIVTVCVSSFMFSGCTRRPNAQQIQALEEQKQAALAAESTVADRKREKKNREDMVNKKRTELQNTKDELEAVKRRLNEMQ